MARMETTALQEKVAIQLLVASLLAQVDELKQCYFRLIRKREPCGHCQSNTHNRLNLDIDPIILAKVESFVLMSHHRVWGRCG